MDVKMTPSKGIHLDLSNSSLLTFPEDLPDFKDLKELRADFNCLKNIDDNRFSTANNLEKIDLSHNEFKHIPTCFETSLKNLRIINLSHNYITSVPNLACLQHLRELYLNNNYIEHVPEWILNEHYRFTILDLSNNPLFRNASYVDEYRLKGRIAYLNLGTTGLTRNNVSLLRQFWCATRLNVSNIHYGKKMNSISSIQPGEIPDSLTWFEAINVQLTTSPDLIRLERLEYLDLSENTIFSINSKTILPSLRVLILQNCKIFEFPHNMDDLINIVHLDLSSNEIISLPRSFNQLSTLVHLDLYNNEFALLPSLDGLKCLKRFDICCNYFEIDPELEINNTKYEYLRDALRSEIKIERSNEEKVYKDEIDSYSSSSSESESMFEENSNSDQNEDSYEWNNQEADTQLEVSGNQQGCWGDEEEKPVVNAVETEQLDDFDPTKADNDMEEKPFNEASVADIISYCPENVRSSKFFYLPFQGRDRESYKDVNICNANQIVEGQFDDCSE